MSVGSGSLSSFWILCRESGRHGASLNLQVVCLAFATAYVLVFPTLMSAMTGYTTRWTPYIGQEDGTMVLLAHYDIVKYIVHNGQQLGLEQDALVYAEINFLGDTPNYYDGGLRTAIDLCKAKALPLALIATSQTDWSI